MIALDTLCRYCSTSGITSYSIDFFIYTAPLRARTYLDQLLDILLALLRPLLILALRNHSPLLILRLSYLHDDLIVDLVGEASLDVHEPLQEKLLLDELVLLELVLRVDLVYLLEPVEALSGLEVELHRKLQHKVVEVLHLLHLAGLLGGSEAASGG